MTMSRIRESYRSSPAIRVLFFLLLCVLVFVFFYLVLNLPSTSHHASTPMSAVPSNDV